MCALPNSVALHHFKANHSEILLNFTYLILEEKYAEKRKERGEGRIPSDLPLQVHHFPCFHTLFPALV
jgi:hypothetical protein